ncbi:MAG: flagellin, partial [Candidatus Sericytochromatia bacterium]|nr:flagellin [Candidatus Tanganyikabacteria bacterium]
MGLKLNSNVPARVVHDLLARNDRALTESLLRLSSGLRINNAGDDVAGMAMSQRFARQVRGLDQASANVQDALNLLFTADGALTETTAILQRMRELAVQAASDTLTVSDRTAIREELADLSTEVDRIGKTTEFNTFKILSGGNFATAGFTIQIGADAGDVLNFKLDTATSAALGVLSTQISVESASLASVTLANLDNALERVALMRSNVGARSNRMSAHLSVLQVQSENMASSLTKIQDLDFAKEVS